MRTAALLALLAGLAIWALSTGASDFGPAEALAALWGEGEDRTVYVMQHVRLPRLIAAMAVGAALAVAGAIIQAMTGNPLADPGLLGVNAGAALAVVCGLALFGLTGMGTLVWLAFGGAALTALTVLALGTLGRGSAGPVRLILAGVILASFIGALTAVILVLDVQTQDDVRQWTIGSLKGRSLAIVLPVLPYIAGGLVAAMLVARQITALSLGEEVARGLGLDPVRWRFAAAALVVVLAGAAVAMAGPLSFVGLVVPHIARALVGADYLRILPACAVGGAILTVTADTLPRALWARDIPVGVTLAMVGAPLFVALVLRRMRP